MVEGKWECGEHEDTEGSRDKIIRVGITCSCCSLVMFSSHQKSKFSLPM